MTWTDLRDGSKWEITATPLPSSMGHGKAYPMEGETSFDLSFSSPGGACYHAVVGADVGSRLDHLLHSELAALLDEARGRLAEELEEEST